MSKSLLSQILEDCFDRAHAAEGGMLRHSALTEVLLETLEDAGVADNPQVAYYLFERGNVAAEVHGYAFDAEDDVIQLFYCIDSTEDTPLGEPAEVRTTGKDQVDRAFRRMDAFVRRVRTDRMEDIEESQPARELVELVRDADRNGHAIELCAVTTGKVSERVASDAARNDLRREVWDIVQLERVGGKRGDGSITIDFAEEFGGALPCLVTPQSPDGLQVLLTCIPGKTLAEIYNRFRASLLERNVRSFLQFTGKVNKGIRSTILDESHRFLPYNNGLSATAGAVEVETVHGSLGRILAVHDFQIVNGGQTTATIASCLRRDRGADLDSVSVSMKLTVVPPKMLDGLVPKISRFANTQNRIQDSDFSANDPWHIAVERLSRDTWTRATADAPRGSRWFYERSRGQYADALAACATPAGRKQFRRENPASQKFTKTDLAKFMLSWDQVPAVVNRGAQKCFVYFMNQLAQSTQSAPDEGEFKRIVALAILFRTIEKLYGEMQYQGYRANVVAYSMARLSYDCGRQIDVDAIWKAQTVPQQFLDALKVIVPGVREVIVSPPANQKNVTEWCKKEDCWTAVLERTIDSGLERKAAAQAVADRPSDATTSPHSAEQQQLIEAAQAVAPDVWFSVSNWAKSTSSLQPWQRSLAYSLGRLVEVNKAPSIKQAVQGRNLLLEAERLGFRHDSLLANQVHALQSLADVSK